MCLAAFVVVLDVVHAGKFGRTDQIEARVAWVVDALLRR